MTDLFDRGLRWLCLAACLAITPALPAENPGAPNLDATVQRLSEEVRRLRTEVIEYRLETQEARVVSLQRDLQALQQELQRLQQEAVAYQMSLGEIDNQLSRQGLSDGERVELEARRNEMRDVDMGRIHQQQAEIVKREAQTRTRLDQEQQRWQTLFQLRASLQQN